MRRSREQRRSFLGMLLSMCAVVGAAVGAGAQIPEADSGTQAYNEPVETAPGESAGQDVFVETAPPPWTAEDYEAPSELTELEPEDVDPALSKVIQDVGVELDRRQGRTPEAEAPPKQPRQRSFFLHSLKGVAALCFVLAIIFVLAYLAKKMGRHTPLFAGSNLARVLGKVHLAPRVSLHFVRTGGKILVVGVTQNAISIVADFDADSFQYEAREEETPESEQAGTPGFLAHLGSHTSDTRKQEERAVQGAGAQGADAERAEAEIAALRNDIQRLQRYLEDNFRGERDK